MKIAGFEKMSLVDYDGKVASTVFTAGCNFRCSFCHNSSLVVGENFPQIDEEEFFAYLKKRQGILDGVCVSGGEPTLQPDLIPFIEKIKDLGYFVKLDTNGTNPEIVKTLHTQGLCDYFAMDIKSSKDDYAKITCIDKLELSKIERTIEYFLTNNVDYEFRTTLISPYHTPTSAIKIGEWIKGAKKYFLQKFVDGENCIKQGLLGVSEDDANAIKNALIPYVPNTKLRGY